MSRKWVLGIILGIIAAAALAYFGSAPLSDGVAYVVGLCRSAGPWVFFGAMAILPLFGFSLFAFVASAGPVFAPTLGAGSVVACGVAALAVNVTLSYVLARYALRPSAERLIRRFGCCMPDLCRYGPWEVCLLVRLLPGPPFGLQSCLLGVAGIPFGAYLVTSLAIPALYIAGMVSLSTGAAAHSPWLAAGSGIALLVVGAAVHRLRRRITRVRPWTGSAAALPEAG